MKIHATFLSILLLHLCLANCDGQEKAIPALGDQRQQKSSLPESDPYFVDSKIITASHGPKSITRNILQDAKGNIWLTTWEGIICYDGKSVHQFYKQKWLETLSCLFRFGR